MTDPRDVPILRLWQDLGGTLPRNCNGRVVRVCCFWTKSTDPNIALYPDTNSYTYYARPDEAGGTVRLVMFRYDCDGKQARQWLQEMYGGEMARSMAPKYSPQELERADAFRSELVHYIDEKLEQLSKDRASSTRAAAIGAYTQSRTKLAELVGPDSRPRDAAKLVEVYRTINKRDPELAHIICARAAETRKIYNTMLSCVRKGRS